MKKWILTGLIVLALTSLACSGLTIRLGGDDDSGSVRIEGRGPLVSESRSVSGFDRIEFNGVGRLRIQQGDSESLTVEAQENVLSHIDTEVEGSTLHISMDKDISIDLDRGITYTLVVKDLQALNLNGLGDVDVESLDTDRLTVELNGAGRMVVDNLQASSLEMSLNGLGSVEIDGQVERQEVNITASGSYDGEDLQCADAVVDVDGLGSAEVWATDNLDVTISGAGSVNYYGSPKVSQEIEGLGRVNHSGNK